MFLHLSHLHVHDFCSPPSIKPAAEKTESGAFEQRDDLHRDPGTRTKRFSFYFIIIIFSHLFLPSASPLIYTYSCCVCCAEQHCGADHVELWMTPSWSQLLAALDPAPSAAYVRRCFTHTTWWWWWWRSSSTRLASTRLCCDRVTESGVRLKKKVKRNQTQVPAFCSVTAYNLVRKGFLQIKWY